MDDRTAGGLMFLAGMAFSLVLVAASHLLEPTSVKVKTGTDMRMVEIGRGFRVKMFDYDIGPSNASVKVEFIKEAK